MGNRFGMYARVAAMAIVFAGAGWAGSAFAEFVRTVNGVVPDKSSGLE